MRNTYTAYPLKRTQSCERIGEGEGMAKDTLTWEQAQEIDEKFSDTGKGLRIVVFYVGGRGNVQELCIPGDDHAPR